MLKVLQAIFWGAVMLTFVVALVGLLAWGSDNYPTQTFAIGMLLLLTLCSAVVYAATNS